MLCKCCLKFRQQWSTSETVVGIAGHVTRLPPVTALCAAADTSDNHGRYLLSAVITNYRCLSTSTDLTTVISQLTNWMRARRLNAFFGSSPYSPAELEPTRPNRSKSKLKQCIILPPELFCGAQVCQISCQGSTLGAVTLSVSLARGFVFVE